MNKEFENLEEEIVNVDQPRPATEYLESFYKSLGMGDKELLGIDTGVTGLNKVILGLRKLSILAGEPKLGKSTLALQLALDTKDHKGNKAPVLFYSLEMDRDYLLVKALSHFSGIDDKIIRLKARPLFDESYEEKDYKKYFKNREEINAILTGDKKLKEVCQYLYIRTFADESPISFDMLETDIAYLQGKYEIKDIFVIIDFLQLFPLDEYRDILDKEQRLISEFSRITNKTGATILLISQMNKRAIENIKTGKGMASVKGTVDNIYIPHFIMLMYRSPKDKDEKATSKRIILDIISRDSKGGKVYLKYLGNKAKFDEVTDEEEIKQYWEE